MGGSRSHIELRYPIRVFVILAPLLKYRIELIFLRHGKTNYRKRELSFYAVFDGARELYIAYVGTPNIYETLRGRWASGGEE